MSKNNIIIIIGGVFVLILGGIVIRSYLYPSNTTPNSSTKQAVVTVSEPSVQVITPEVTYSIGGMVASIASGRILIKTDSLGVLTATITDNTKIVQVSPKAPDILRSEISASFLKFLKAEPASPVVATLLARNFSPAETDMLVKLAQSDRTYFFSAKKIFSAPEIDVIMKFLKTQPVSMVVEKEIPLSSIKTGDRITVFTRQDIEKNKIFTIFQIRTS